MPGDDEQHQEIPDDDATKESQDDELTEARKTFFEALKDLKDSIKNENEMSPPDAQDIPSDPEGQISDDLGEHEDREPPDSNKVFASKSPDPGDEDDYWIGGKKNTDSADNVRIIMKVLEGNFQRSIALRAPHPGGMPRTWKRMSHFDEIEDIDPFEAMIWTENTTPTLPRVHKREREMMGGEIAILRDVSTSMMGVYSEWSSSVVRGVIELARSKRMRVGYVEFNHRSYKYKRNSQFFTRDYNWMLELASKTECSGNTNYEDALKDAISEFRGRGLRNKHILFITDGIPTSGDCDVVAERFRAKKLGVCIHSIFIGSKNYPRILEKISRETSGIQFIATRRKNGLIRIEREDKKIIKPVVEKARVDPFSDVFA